jgi:hypothetical protein
LGEPDGTGDRSRVMTAQERAEHHRRCVAETHTGRRCPKIRTIRVEGNWVCTQHHTHGWIPFFTAAEPEDPRIAERARAVLGLED